MRLQMMDYNSGSFPKIGLEALFLVSSRFYMRVYEGNALWRTVRIGIYPS